MSSTFSTQTKLSATEQNLVERALQAATDTTVLEIEAGIRHRAAEFFKPAFGNVPVLIVADQRTFTVAGADVLKSFRRENIHCEEPFLFPDDVFGESSFVAMLEQRLQSTPAIPVAVGAGTINDLAKLASFRQGREYLTVATAASMDGYTAYGASITHHGSKQTFDCPAPRVVLADLETIESAPVALNASGYADLLAKGAAGADWILADAGGEEPIHALAWSTVQDALPNWVKSPREIAEAQPECLHRLVLGLMLSGFAMQAARSSRPASGAEHQFSHLWDMQHHTHHGLAPSHGFKVGIGTCASLRLYRFLLRQDLTTLNIEQAVERWPSLDEMVLRIRSLFGFDALGEKAVEETRAKYRDRHLIRTQLTSFTRSWPELREKLRHQLRPFEEAEQMLHAAKCPFEPEQIGISRTRLKNSFEQAFFLRRRFTVLDFAVRCGLLEPALKDLFGPEGAWKSDEEQVA